MDTKDTTVNSQPVAATAPSNQTIIPIANPAGPSASEVHSAGTPPVPPLSNASSMPPLGVVPVKKSHKKLFIIIGIIVTLLVLLLSAGATLAAVAYDKISLGNPELEEKIEQFVVGLPFMPKNAAYILNASAVAHAKHSKHAFNLSLSAQSDDTTTSALGLNNFDVEAKGDIDYTDPKNVMFSINASVTKDFNIDIKKKDPIVYFKVNKIPALIYSYMQMDQKQAEPILTQWVQYDTSTLDTEARRTLDSEVEEGNSLTDEYLENTLNDFLDQNILEKTKVSDEQVDGVNAYLFDLKADDKTIDDLVERMNSRVEGKDENVRTLNTDTTRVKPSAYINDLHIKFWIEKGSYLIRKISTTFEYDQAGIYPTSDSMVPSRVLGISTDILGVEDMLMGSSKVKYKIATVVGLSDFGKEIKVETPAKSVKIEELVNQLMGAMGTGSSSSSSGSPLELSKRSRDAVRLTDLANLQQAINVAIQESTGSSYANLLCVGGLTAGKCIGTSIISARKPDGTGWVKANLNEQRSVSVPTLPVDPVNSDDYHYTYCSDGNNWEINTRLESEQQAPKMGNDGGDQGKAGDLADVLLTDGIYEVGSKLTLIGPDGSCKY